MDCCGSTRTAMDNRMRAAQGVCFGNHARFRCRHVPLTQRFAKRYAIGGSAFQ